MAKIFEITINDDCTSSVRYKGILLPINKIEYKQEAGCLPTIKCEMIAVDIAENDKNAQKNDK